VSLRSVKKVSTPPIVVSLIELILPRAREDLWLLCIELVLADNLDSLRTTADLDSSLESTYFLSESYLLNKLEKIPDFLFSSFFSDLILSLIEFDIR
jgi:hypothetical protein